MRPKPETRSNLLSIVGTFRPAALACLVTLFASACELTKSDPQDVAVQDSEDQDLPLSDLSAPTDTVTADATPDVGPELDATSQDLLPPADVEVIEDTTADVQGDTTEEPSPYALFAVIPTWGTTPWPDDRFRGEDGHLRIPAFETADNSFAQDYLATFERRATGYPSMPVIYVPFSTMPDSLALPSPADSRMGDSPVRLIAFPSDNDCETAVPIEIKVLGGTSPFLLRPAIAASPVHGHALLPNTRYALVVEAVVADPPLGRAPSFDETWNAAAGPLAGLAACLGEGADRVVAATVFTTADSTRELKTFVDHVLDAAFPLPVLTDWGPNASRSAPERTVYIGDLPVPIFQSGQLPYSEVGTGDLTLVDGLPAVQRTDRAPITIAWDPRVAETPRPVVLWVGGTGINRYGHLTDAAVKAALAEGFVVVSFLPQFHGPRAVAGTSEVAGTFNYLNPDGGRGTIRQQAIETALIARWIKTSLANLADVPAIDTAHLTYGGHSQGAIAGSLLAGVSDVIGTWVFGGLGGHLSTTLVERKDPFDIRALLALVLDEPEDQVDRFHPIVQLAQAAGDVVDPGAYVGHWLGGLNHGGVSVLTVNGNADATSPVRGIDTITTLSGAGVLGDNVWDYDPFNVSDITTVSGGVSGNAVGRDGQALTAVAWLFTGGNHYVLTSRDAVGVSAARFLKDGAQGRVPAVTP